MLFTLPTPSRFLPLLALVACGGEVFVQLPDDEEADLAQRRDMLDTDDDLVGQPPDDMRPAPPDQAADLTIIPDASPDMRPAPDMAPAQRVYTVAIISDLNNSYGSTTYGPEVHDAIRWITQTARPELVLSTGDMVAGQKAGLDYDAMWTAFHAAVTEPLAQAGIPLAPTPGNHDASGYNGFQQERERYIAQWLVRRPRVQMVDDTFFPLYYAFEQGPALFISLDDTLVAPLGGAQMMWLDDVLSRHADKPVKIVYGHIPQVPFTQGREDEIIGDPALDQLLERHRVTAFISGHHHGYYPGKRGSVRHISMACLGAGPRRLIGDDIITPRAVVLLHYDTSGLLSVEAYTGQGMREIIPRALLPGMITHGEWTIFRDDL